MNQTSRYGIAAEFDDPGLLVKAARTFHDRGFRQIEAYTPYPIHQLDEVIEAKPGLARLVLAAGVTGTITGWVLQTYITVIDYPINVGGRPLYSWPAYIVIMFELTVLFAAGAAFFGTLAKCRLPRLRHPIFNVPGFDQSSNNRFYLCVESRDPQFDVDEVTELLEELSAVEVHDVADD